ncbi:MAG: hypothetical protein GY821_16865 [Gammaproteobacteria bacterium]|nr:hypothetical protein [Gammaproteobacteria bacterium]
MKTNNYYLQENSSPPEEKMTIRDVALNMANNTQSLSGGFSLLHDLEEFDAIEALYFLRERDVDGGDYAVYRKLSTTLHQHGKHLVATLLRRHLVDCILATARYKSYKYAASDMKLAGDFSAPITDWRDYQTHTQYVDKLKTTHQRKLGFWKLVKV